MEICFVPETDHASQYPGVFFFTTPARMMRPVKNLMTRVVELIGTMEQVYLHIPTNSAGVNSGVSKLSTLKVVNYLYELTVKINVNNI